MKVFLGFILISGVGWALDLISYTVFTQAIDLAPAYANFMSSMLGVTFVWLTALNQLFKQKNHKQSIYLPMYWGYQTASILAYSFLISSIVTADFNLWASLLFNLPAAVTAKCILTPANLLTNFLFMSYLAGIMKNNSNNKI